MGYNIETEMYDGYIYCIENMINHKKYIGQTSRDIAIRYDEHLKSDDDCPIHRAIQKYKAYNFNVYQLERIEQSCFEDLSNVLNIRETFWIKYHDSKSNGYNCNFGGRDASQLQLSRKIVCYDIINDCTSTYDTMCVAAAYLKCDQGSLSKACNSPFEFHRVGNCICRFIEDGFTDDDIEQIKVRYPKIFQYATNGELIKIHNNLSGAVKYLENNGVQVCRDHIRNSCCRNNGTAYGFVWRKYPDVFNDYQVEIRYLNPVEQHDINTGELIKIFDSAAEAARCVGIDECGIGGCLNEQSIQKTAGGYFWCRQGCFDVDDFLSNRFYNRKVVQYTRSGEYVTTFNNACEAARSLGKDAGKIRSVCNGDRKTAYGFVWRFYGDSFCLYDAHSNKYRPVNMYSLDGAYIRTFMCVQDIKDALGFDGVTGVYKCCKHKTKTSHGYLWFYIDDETQPDKNHIDSY